MNVYDYIRTETNPLKLYDGIREILKYRRNYPEDWEIKQIQRLADARYSELTKEL